MTKNIDKIIEAKKKQRDKIQDELFSYVAENVGSSDGDGDWVEYIENHEECLELQEQIDKLDDEIKELKKLGA